MKRGQTKRTNDAGTLLSSETEDVARKLALRPEQVEALGYIKEMLPALRIIAVNAELKFLCYLLEMANEEAEMLSGSANPQTM